jgi:hypothetical protein
MTDLVCSPICGPNPSVQLPGNNPLVVPTPVLLGADCTLPMHVKLCNPSEFDTNTLCDPATGLPVLVITSYSDTGVPTSTAYNADGTPHTANAISALVACGSSSESDPIEMCDAGATPFIRWVVKKNGAPTGVSFDTTMNGAPYALVGPATFGSCAVPEIDYEHTQIVEVGCANGEVFNRITTSTYQNGVFISSTVTFIDAASNTTATPPAGWVLGECPANRVIVTDGITLAGPLRAATPEFAGAVDTVDVSASIAANFPTGILMSFTVTAFDTVPGLLGLTADQVILNMVSLGGPNFTGSVNLNDGETRTFSVARDQDARLIASSPTVVVTGNAYAHITWTFQS